MVRIIADSTCDLSPELVNKYNITIVPLYVRLGEKEYRDGMDISPKDLFAWSDKNHSTPKTAAPGIEDYAALLTDEDSEYVIFTISSSMSASFNNARLAADELEITDRVFVIDSENLSTGIGLLIIAAAEMAQQGKTAGEIADAVLALRPKVRASFVIDTLTYLYRGGRCSGLAAVFGAALRIHPRIAVIDGAMHPEKKYRGTARKYVIDYVKDMEESLRDARPERVFITHNVSDREIVDSVREYLESLDHFDEILETNPGGVVSSHCGPGTLGVLFMAK